MNLFRWRLVVLFISLSWSALVFRAAQLQLTQAAPSALSDRAKKQFYSTKPLQQMRGTLFDAEGFPLAYDIPAYSLFIDPSRVQAPKEVTRQLSAHIGLSRKVLNKKLKQKNKKFVWIKRKLSQNQMETIKSLNLRGLHFRKEYRRVHSLEESTNALLGKVGLDHTGLSGLEYSLDQKLLQRPKSYRSYLKDARGIPLLDNFFFYMRQHQSKDLTLTIHSDIQHKLYEEVKSQIEEVQAKAGWGIILEAKTNKIRGLVSIDTHAKSSKHLALQENYEPGSVLKALTFATALDSNKTNLDEVWPCMAKGIKLGKRSIKETNYFSDCDTMTTEDAFAHSSNVVTSMLALRIGQADLIKSFKAFGLGKKIGVGYPAEARGLLVDRKWGDHFTANLAFGQGVSLTGLQLAQAYSVFANEGLLVEPTLLEGSPLTQKRRILSKKTVSKMKNLLGLVIEEGTGVNAQILGSKVGGKTGTAQKALPGVGYQKGLYVATFAGVLPLDNPEYTMVISIDEPQSAYYASDVAAPVFQKMGAYLLRRQNMSIGYNDSYNDQGHLLPNKNK